MPPKAKISRDAILKEALRIVEEEGLAHLTLRTLAKNLRVAPNAIYHYFPDRIALEADVARSGWATLLKSLQRARRANEGFAALAGQVRAFVRFTQRHPALYRLMLVPRAETAAEMTMRMRYREFNMAAYGPLVPQETIDRARRLVWSLLHGMTALHRSGMTPEIEDLEQEAAEAVGLLLGGIAGRSR